MSQTLRVPIAAENTSAQFGGEAALSLHFFRVMRARGKEVWLVTRAELSALYPNDTRICYIEDTALHKVLWRLGSGFHTGSPTSRPGFSHACRHRSKRRIVRRLVREHGISIVHQPMPVSPREPSMPHGFGIPVLICPMNACILVEPTSRSALIERLADAMVRLAKSADLGLALDRAGRAKVVREFDWETA